MAGWVRPVASPDFSYSRSQEGLNSPGHDGGDGLEPPPGELGRPPAGTARRRRAAGRTPRSEVAPSRRESQRSAGCVHGSGRHRLSHVPAFREGGRQGTAHDPGVVVSSPPGKNPHDRVLRTARQEGNGRHLRWPGAASSSLVSRSRACRPEAGPVLPVGAPSRPRHGAIGSTRSRAHPRCRRPVAAAFHGNRRELGVPHPHPVTSISARASRVTGIPVTRLRLLGCAAGREYEKSGLGLG